MKYYFCFIIVVFTLLVSSCGGRSSGTGAEIVGKWQPVDIEIKTSKLFQSFVDEAKDYLWSDELKQGLLELKKDGRFILVYDPDSESYTGQWELQENTLQLSFKDDFTLNLTMDELTADILVIDFFPAYKAFTNYELPNIPGLKFKLLMKYQRMK